MRHCRNAPASSVSIALQAPQSWPGRCRAFARSNPGRGRLVVLSIDHAYSKEPENAAEAAAKAIFETRGSAPRLYRNTLAFLAADKTRWQESDEAVRKLLAGESILNDKNTLDLSPHQVKQAETQTTAADGVVTARLPETYQRLLVPTRRTQTPNMGGAQALRSGPPCGTR